MAMRKLTNTLVPTYLPIDLTVVPLAGALVCDTDWATLHTGSRLPQVPDVQIDFRLARRTTRRLGRRLPYVTRLSSLSTQATWLLCPVEREQTITLPP